MRNFFTLAVAVSPLLAHAIVATTSQTASGSADASWAYVGKMSGASAVAISPYAVLTASHVVAGDFALGGKSYRMESTELAPTIGRVTTDLRVVHLLDALPGWYAVGTSVVKGATVSMVGYGGTGVVNAAGTGYWINGAAGRRAGGNAISSKETTDGRGPTMRALLDAAGEAALVGGDSGGGWFSGGKLVGISAFTFTKDANKPAYGFAKKAYFGSGAVDLTNTSLRSWITVEAAQRPVIRPKNGPQAVPEPTSLLALAFGAGAFARRRRQD